MRVHIILRYVGMVLIFNSIFLFISFLISAFNHDSAVYPLLYSTIVTLLFGIFPLIFVPPSTDITNQEGYGLVVISWLLSCLVGIIPYVLWGGEFNLTNAWFESVSGFTTTGSTILTNVEALPRGLLFWRSSTHWIGGIGIVLFVLVVLPSMARAKLTLYKYEMSELAMENFRYKTRQVMQIILWVYIGLTVLETILLMIFGMDLFDAVTHSFATIATGGFSTKNMSIAAYHSVAIEVVVMIFMFLSGIHFGLLYATIMWQKKNLVWKSSIVKYYFWGMVIGILLVTFNLYTNKDFPTFGESLRYASFQIISVGTTTGFATAPSEIWPPFSQLMLLFFTLQCACAGSTSGGLKVDRVMIFFKAIRKQIVHSKHPNAVVTLRLGKNLLKDEVVETTLVFIVLYLLIVFGTGLILSFMGVDMLSAFSASAATMGNVGPGLSNVSSLGNFSTIPDPGKWLLSLNMLLGRLEIFGFLYLFMLRSWK
ncbi:MAG TPA: TrkH family potassium uptake protein [Bacteroidales bacterium]|nr:TrkH family potassium uptake protein [Bacteroidales bacterium]